MQISNLLNDVSFWINIAMGLISFIVVFLIKSNNKSIGEIKINIKELYQKSETNTTDIATTKTDLKNHRDECREKHSSR